MQWSPRGKGRTRVHRDHPYRENRTACGLRVPPTDVTETIDWQAGSCRRCWPADLPMHVPGQIPLFDEC